MSDTISSKEELYNPGQGSTSLDFIGFSFNGVSSEDLGIVRVSASDRYNDITIPTFQDKSAQMPGSDYTLYWESYYNTRSWTVNIAFDEMSDMQLRLFRRTFNGKDLGQLQFREKDDVTKMQETITGTYEHENIYYMAKLQSSPQLNYLCFDIDPIYRKWTGPVIPGMQYYNADGSTYSSGDHYEKVEKLYKGEGTIQFIAYFPFGIRDVGITTTYDEDGANLKWNGTILPTGYTTAGGSGTALTNGASTIKRQGTFTNKGDMPADWIMSIRWDRANFLTKISIDSSNALTFNFGGSSGVIPSDGSTSNHTKFILVNSKSNLVEEAYYNSISNEWEYTGTVYNSCITGGDFFKMPVGECTFTTELSATHTGGDYLYYRHLYL